MEILDRRIRLGMAIIAFLLTATAAPAQRLSLADVEQKLAALEAQLARVEPESLAEPDAPEAGLRLLYATFDDPAQSEPSLFLVGHGFGAAQGDEQVLLAPRDSSNAPAVEALTIVGWSDWLIEALLPDGLASEGYTAIVSNRTPPPGRTALKAQ